MSEYFVSTDRALIDVEAVCRLLHTTYWAKDRPCEAIEKSLDGSINFGVYAPDGSQVGFARVITDYATVFYLCDVVIDEAHRGRGLGKMLVQAVVSEERIAHLRGMLLTSSAHGLYKKFGFEQIDGKYMTRNV